MPKPTQTIPYQTMPPQAYNNHRLHCATLYYSVPHYIVLNLSILIKKVITWLCGGVLVVWYNLAIIKPPQTVQLWTELGCGNMIKLK